MNLLLDTCTFLWLVSDQKKLSSKALEVIGDEASQLHVSSISAFEVALKVQKGALTLSGKVEKWFAESLAYHGVEEIPLDSQVLIKSAGLPSHHKDPADRMIVATALVADLSIVTPDELIRKYTASVIW